MLVVHSHFFIFKPKTVLFFIFLMLSGFSIFPTPAHASEWTYAQVDYYVEHPPKSGTYKKNASWKITNSNEWATFNNNVISSTKVPEIPNPLTPGNGNFFHLKHVDDNQIVSEDFYITANGILQKSQQATDYYYYGGRKFFDYIRQQINTRSEFTSATRAGHIDIAVPGIVVIINASAVLGNPTWVVKDPKETRLYLNYIKKLRPISMMNSTGGDSKFDQKGSFLLYLNYPDAPGDLLTLIDKDSARITKVSPQKYSYLDDKNYYEHFMKEIQKKINLRKGLKENLERDKEEKAF